MTPRSGAMSTEVKVGLLFFIGLGLLVWFTLFVTRVGSAKGEYAVHFPQVARLKEGDAVTYNGVKVGTVTAVAPDLREGRPLVRVAFSIESRHKDKVLVDAATQVRIQLPPLGGATMDLSSQGGESITPEALMTLAGQAPVGLDEAIASVRSLVEENRTEIRRAVTAVGDGMDRFGKMSDEVRVLIEENRPAVKVAVANVGDAAGEIRAAVAENRQDLRAAVSRIATAAAEVTAMLQENRDSLRAAIAKAPDMIAAIEQAGAQVRDTVAENRAGLKATIDGTAALGGRLDAIGANLQRITEQIASGRGTLGRLVMEDTVHDKATATLDSLQQRLDEVKPVTSGFADLRFIGGLDSGMNTSSGVATSHAYLRIEPRPWKFYQFGVGYRSAGDREVVEDDPEKLGIDFDLLVGWRFLPDDESQRYRLTVAGGLIDSKIGGMVTVPLGSDHLAWTTLGRAKHSGFDEDDRRYEEGDVLLRSYIGWRPWSRIEIRAGADDLVDDPSPWFGISGEILDNDLRNLAVGAVVVR